MATKGDRALYQQVVTQLLEAAIRDGEIDPTGKSDEELEAEFLAFLRRASAPDAKFNVIIDHIQTLLGEARAYRKAGQNQLACVLYATWAEHFLNGLVVTGATRKGLSEDDGIQMVRDLSYRSKVTWVPKLVGFRKIAPAHQKALLRIGELRNQYVHYKWRGFDVDLEKDDEFEGAVGDFEKTVEYLRGYERREVFSGRKAAPRDFTRARRRRRT